MKLYQVLTIFIFFGLFLNMSAGVSLAPNNSGKIVLVNKSAAKIRVNPFGRAKGDKKDNPLKKNPYRVAPGKTAVLDYVAGEDVLKNLWVHFDNAKSGDEMFFINVPVDAKVYPTALYMYDNPLQCVAVWNNANGSLSSYPNAAAAVADIANLTNSDPSKGVLRVYQVADPKHPRKDGNATLMPVPVITA